MARRYSPLVRVAGKIVLLAARFTAKAVVWALYSATNRRLLGRRETRRIFVSFRDLAKH